MHCTRILAPCAHVNVRRRGLSGELFNWNVFSPPLSFSIFLPLTFSFSTSSSLQTKEEARGASSAHVHQAEVCRRLIGEGIRI